MNWALWAFYLLYCIYFYFSALQIRFGLPELRKGNFTMEGTTPINKAAFKTFQAIPFLWELRIVTDWTFTKTSLDLFQWFKFENLYGSIFIAKCTNKALETKVVGSKQVWYMKFGMGFLFMIGIIAIIAGPLLLFSTANPVAVENYVYGGTLGFEITFDYPDPNQPIQTFQIFSSPNLVSNATISDAVY